MGTLIALPNETLGVTQAEHMTLIFNPDGSKMSKRDKDKALKKAVRDAGLETSPIDAIAGEGCGGSGASGGAPEQRDGEEEGHDRGGGKLGHARSISKRRLIG